MQTTELLVPAIGCPTDLLSLIRREKTSSSVPLRQTGGKMREIIVFLFALVLCSTLAAAQINIPLPPRMFNVSPTHFYVADAGSDSNSGASPDQAWQTVAKVNSFHFPNGVTVSFNGGDTFSGGIVASTNNLTIDSYGTGQAAINSGLDMCVKANDVAALTITNITCVGAGDTVNNTDGIRVQNDQADNTQLAGPTISNVTASGYGQSCIDIFNANGTSGFTNVAVTNSVIHDCAGPACLLTNSTASIGKSHGPKYFFKNVNFLNNLVYNCIGNSLKQSGDGILLLGTTIGLVANNVVHDGGQFSITQAGPVGIIVYSSAGVTVESNEVYNWTSGGGDGELLDFDGGVTNSIMQYNYGHGFAKMSYILAGDFNGLANTDNTYRFNIIESIIGPQPSIFLFVCGSGCGAQNVYNNTFYESNSAVIIFGNNATPLTIANNIISSSGGQSISWGAGTAPTLTGNNYYANDGSGSFEATINGTDYTSLAAFHAAGFEKIGGSAVGTTANPNLSKPGSGGTCDGHISPCPSAYELTSGSPAGQRKGLNLNSIYGYIVGNRDFFGNAITNTMLPIGAAANK